VPKFALNQNEARLTSLRCVSTKHGGEEAQCADEIIFLMRATEHSRDDLLATELADHQAALCSPLSYSSRAKKEGGYQPSAQL
jgi:hypothetical protein